MFHFHVTSVNVNALFCLCSFPQWKCSKFFLLLRYWNFSTVIILLEKTASVPLWQRGIRLCSEHTGLIAFCWFLQLSIRFFISCVTAPSDTRTVHHSHPREREISSFSCNKFATGGPPLWVGTHGAVPTDARRGLVFSRPPQRAAGRTGYKVAISICCTLSPSSAVYNMCIQANMLICFIIISVILSYLTS